MLAQPDAPETFDWAFNEKDYPVETWRGTFRYHAAIILTSTLMLSESSTHVVPAVEMIVHEINDFHQKR